MEYLVSIVLFVGILLLLSVIIDLILLLVLGEEYPKKKERK